MTAVFVAVVSFLFSSCSNENEEAHLQQPFNEFATTYNKSIPDILSISVWKNAPNKKYKGREIDGERHQNVYLNIPNDIEDSVKIKLSANLHNLRDIAELKDATGATITNKKITEEDIAITIPTTELQNKLEPMLVQSKKYLYAQGFSESEIQDMLKENNADESELIPLVLALVEQEEVESLANIQNDGGNAAQYAPNWKKIGNCAAAAIGLDIVTNFKLYGPNKWAKKAIKKAFKTVAKRALGPIGVGIAVVEFSSCMGWLSEIF